MAVLPSSDSTLLPSQYQPVPSRKQPQAPSNDTVAAIAAGHQPASSFPSLEEDHSKLQPKAGLPVPSHVTLHVSSLSEPRPKPQLKRLGSKSPTQPSPRLTSSTTDIAARRQCKDTQEARDNHNAIERARRDNLNQQFLVLASKIPSISEVQRPSKSLIVNRAMQFVADSLAREQQYRRMLVEVHGHARVLADQLNEYRMANGLLSYVEQVPELVLPVRLADVPRDQPTTRVVARKGEHLILTRMLEPNTVPDQDQPLDWGEPPEFLALGSNTFPVDRLSSPGRLNSASPRAHASISADVNDSANSSVNASANANTNANTNANANTNSQGYHPVAVTQSVAASDSAGASESTSSTFAPLSSLYPSSSALSDLDLNPHSSTSNNIARLSNMNLAGVTNVEFSHHLAPAPAPAPASAPAPAPASAPAPAPAEVAVQPPIQTHSAGLSLHPAMPAATPAQQSASPFSAIQTLPEDVHATNVPLSPELAAASRGSHDAMNVQLNHVLSLFHIPESIHETGCSSRDSATSGASGMLPAPSPPGTGTELPSDTSFFTLGSYHAA